MKKSAANGKAKKASGSAARSAPLTGARALAILRPRLAAIPKKDVAPPRADVGAAAIAAEALARRARGPELRVRFEKMAEIGEFDMGDLELLTAVALAAQEAGLGAARALAKGAHAKVPLALIKDAAQLEHRMQTVCEHTLSGIDAANAELHRLSPGTSYRDLANDLEGYAALYVGYAAEVKKDGVNYRDADPKAAVVLARKIYDALGNDLTQRDHAALDTLARVWRLLLDVYDRVATVGRFLTRSGAPAASFPSLYAIARPGGGRPKKPSAERPIPATPSAPATPTT